MRNLNIKMQSDISENMEDLIQKRLLELCAQRRITLDELPGRAGLPQSRFDRAMKKGLFFSPADIFVKICNALGVTLGQFFDHPFFAEAGMDTGVYTGEEAGRPAIHYITLQRFILDSCQKQGVTLTEYAKKYPASHLPDLMSLVNLDMDLESVQSLYDDLGVTVSEFFATPRLDHLVQDIIIQYAMTGFDDPEEHADTVWTAVELPRALREELVRQAKQDGCSLRQVIIARCSQPPKSQTD